VSVTELVTYIPFMFNDPSRKISLVTFLLCCCPLQDCGDRSASSCVDTEEFVDEIGYTCFKWVGYDCTVKNTFINAYGFTPEGWKDLLRNCPVSCNLCDSKASSRRHLEDDLSSDPCVCMPTWGGLVKVDPTCANQQGCPASACDNDPLGPWCLVVNLGCATAEGDGSWAYCSPGTTVIPTELLLLVMSLFHTPSLSISLLCSDFHLSFLPFLFRARGGNPIFGYVRGHRGVCRQSRIRL
jgi:hypothetical protein